MSVLRSRLYLRELAKLREADSAARPSRVGGGDRSDKIRTYNYPQDRLTDHRIGLDLSALPRVMDGEIDRLIDALVMADQADRLASITGGDDAAAT
jgi:peptide chain release factor 1